MRDIDILAHVFWYHGLLCTCVFGQHTFQHIDFFFLLTFWHKYISATWTEGQRDIMAQRYFVTLDVLANGCYSTWTFRHGDISVPHTTPRQNMQLNPSAVKSLCLNISVPKYLWYQNIPMQESPCCQNYPLAEISQCFFYQKNAKKITGCSNEVAVWPSGPIGAGKN